MRLSIGESVVASCVSAFVLAAPATMWGAVFVNFEQPTYQHLDRFANTTAVANGPSVDGWKVIDPFNGDNGSRVYDSGFPGGGAPLEGAQSGFSASWNSGIGKRFNTSGNINSGMFGDGMIFSMVAQAHTNTGGGGAFFPGNDAALWVDATVPGGIRIPLRFNHDTGTFLSYGASSVNTGIPFTYDNVYKLEWEINSFANQQFTVYVTDLTNAGPRLNGGTYTASFLPTDPSVLYASGGMGVFTKDSNNGLLHDDYQVIGIPEPAILGLLALGLPMALRRRS